MLKQEFEKMAMAEGEAISTHLYEAIVQYYMETEETKQEFVERVFGHWANNSERQIVDAVWRLASDQNRKALRGNDSATPQVLLKHDKMLLNHYNGLANWK